MTKKQQGHELHDHWIADLSAEDCNNRLAAADYDMRRLSANGNNHPNVRV